MEKQAGLTGQEVEERIRSGQVNRMENHMVKTNKEIVKAHLLTYFNFLNLFLAILVLITGQFKNMTFMGVVIVNAVIGIVQELKVKKVVDKLTVLTASKAHVVREGEKYEIDIEEVVKDDILIVTNGDQTDTIYEGMDKQLTFEQSLRSREFEPDAPNYTPRISGVLHVENGKFSYAMSILKSNNGNPESCNRFTYTYENPIAGEGRFIHTYMHDGNPLPSFEGEPKLVAIEEDIDDFTNTLWNSLNEDNKVSLFVRYIDIATGNYESKIVNKNKITDYTKIKMFY